MEIRRATLEDAMAIASVHVRSWKSAYPGQIPQGYLDSLHPKDRVEGWEQVLAATDWPREGVFLLVDIPRQTPDQNPKSGRRPTGIRHLEGSWASRTSVPHATTISTQLRPVRSHRSTLRPKRGVRATELRSWRRPSTRW